MNEELRIKKLNKPKVSVYEDDTIATAVHLFKTYRISKLIVVNKEFKLKGVLSYYDIIHFLISPRQKAEVGRHQGKGSKDSIDHQRVQRFSKNYILTLHEDEQVKKALDLVLEKRIGSVVIIDHNRHPVGIVTTRDFFNILLQRSRGLRFRLFDKNLSEANRQMVQSFLKPFYRFLKKVPNFSEATLTVKEEKNGGLFKVFFSIFPQKGRQTTLKKEGKDLKELLQEVKEGVKNKKASK